jgi:hypothetical protein
MSAVICNVASSLTLSVDTPGSGHVVPKARVEVGEIDRVVDQVIQRMLERPWQQLPRQIDGQEPRVRIYVLVASHVESPAQAVARRSGIHD